MIEVVGFGISLGGFGMVVGVTDGSLECAWNGVRGGSREWGGCVSYMKNQGKKGKVRILGLRLRIEGCAWWKPGENQGEWNYVQISDE